MSARPVTAAIGETAAQTLGHGGDVGHNAVMLHGKQLARAGKTGLHFIGNQQDAVLVGQFAQLHHEGARHFVKSHLPPEPVPR